jgi:nucleotide-binding universal stress UspA family protein
MISQNLLTNEKKIFRMMLERKLKQKQFKTRAMKNIHYFVPVDFSESSQNALHYALVLATASGGSIDLLHITDADEVVESDNPVVVLRCLDELEERAARRIQSLAKIIAKAHISLSSTEVYVGNITVVLQRMTKQLSPDVIVMGKSKNSIFTEADLSSIIHNEDIACPIVVVPDSFRPQLPSTIVLTSDVRYFASKPLISFLEIVEPITHNLSLLNIYKNTYRTIPYMWPLLVDSTPDRNADLLEHENRPRHDGIQMFLSCNPVDLLCSPKTAEWTPLRHAIKEILQLEVPAFFI